MSSQTSRPTRATKLSIKAQEAKDTADLAAHVKAQRASQPKTQGLKKTTTGTVGTTSKKIQSQKPAAAAAAAGTGSGVKKARGHPSKSYTMAPATKTRGRPKSNAAVTSKAKGKASTKATASATAKQVRKRKTNDADEDGDAAAAAAPPAPAKKARVTKASKASKAPVVKEKIVINHAPTQRLDVYVFGEGSAGELGLGTAKNAVDVKRPRLNPNLRAKDVGVVQLCCGGMHALALTHDGKVLSWGVNDAGALGRNTDWSGGLKDVDDDKSDASDDSDSGLNPHEAAPGEVKFPEGTVIVKVAAGDSISLALTNDGHVYGWGGFRGVNGPIGFWRDMSAGHVSYEAEVADENSQEKRKVTLHKLAGVIEFQTTPRLYTELSDIVDICCGSNHCLARDHKGLIFTWGVGEQNQLGRRIIERLDVDQKKGLIPQPLRTGKTHFKAIFGGPDHSFAIDSKDHVYAWGFNGCGNLGFAEQKYFKDQKETKWIPAEDITAPTIIPALTDASNPVVQLVGGQKHSMAVQEDGTLLTWGLIAGGATGLDASKVSESALLYNPEQGRGHVASAVIDPTPVPGIGKAVHVGAGSEQSFGVNTEGKAFSWGSNAVYQLGIGNSDDQMFPTLIDNTAVRDKKLNWASGGGQYSMLTAPAVVDNGINGS